MFFHFMDDSNAINEYFYYADGSMGLQAYITSRIRIAQKE